MLILPTLILLILNLMNKRFTFKGVINAQQQKLPQKSRSRSHNRSKASSISKNVSITNRSSHSNSKSTKVEPRAATSQSSKPSENIFRSSKRNYEQEVMKKIIKLKNSTMQLQNTLKGKTSKNAEKVMDNKENQDDVAKMESMQNFMEEFDAEIRRQTKEIGEFYMKQIDDMEPGAEDKQLQLPEFKPLSIPYVVPSMTALQGKLQQIERSWFGS